MSDLNSEWNLVKSYQGKGTSLVTLIVPSTAKI